MKYDTSKINENKHTPNARKIIDLWMEANVFFKYAFKIQFSVFRPYLFF